MPTFTAADLAQQLAAEVAGDGAVVLTAVKPLQEALAGDLSFLDNPAYVKFARETQASAVLVHPKAKDDVAPGAVKLITDKPYVAFARALTLFYPQAEVQPGFSNMAVISGTAEVDPTARVEPGAVIYEHAKIGAGTRIGAHTVVGQGVEIGANCEIAPGVTLLNCAVGDQTVIQSGVRVGQDGFGFAMDERDIIKVPQVGGVQIGSRVEIGANTTIDRGALGDTVIADDVKIDCLVQIGHNVKIGHHSRIVAQVGIAGSAVLGPYSLIGGQSGIAGHLELAEGVMVAARAGVTKTIDVKGAVVAGFPAMPLPQWRKLQALLSRMSKAAKIRKNPAYVADGLNDDAAAGQS